MEVTIGKEKPIASQEKTSGHFSDNKKIIYCPITDVLDRISDKWSVHTIIVLGKADKMRFGELMKSIHGISQRMLTVTLRNLERDGLLTRQVYPEIPPRVEYRLTELGRGLLLQLVRLSEWASENMQQVLEAREKYAEKG